jgi:hypothetical protein
MLRGMVTLAAVALTPQNVTTKQAIVTPNCTVVIINATKMDFNNTKTVNKK